MENHQNKSQRWEMTKWPSHRQEAVHSGPPGLQPVHKGGDAQRPWFKGLRIHQGNFLPWIWFMIIQRKYQTSFCRRLLTSALPCWKLLASPIQSGAPSSCRSTVDGVHNHFISSTYIGQRKTNRPKLKSFYFPGQRHVRCWSCSSDIEPTRRCEGAGLG